MSNKCDHNKESFKQYERPSQYKKPPTQILNLITSFYKAIKNRLSDLNKMLNSLLRSKRGRRSERREVYQGVMKFILEHYDLMSGKVSRFTLKDIAHWCGFSIDRVEAVISDFDAAGFITKKVMYVIKGPNNIKTSSTEITICNLFFKTIGYGNAKLEEAKTYRRKKDFSVVAKSIMKEATKMLKSVDTVFKESQPIEKQEPKKMSNSELVRLRQNATAKMVSLGLTTDSPNWRELSGWPG